MGLLLVLASILPIMVENNYSSTDAFDYNDSSEQHKFSTNNQFDYSLKKLAQYDTGYGRIRDIHIKDNLAITVSHKGGLIIFDISDPSYPLPIGFYDEPMPLSDSSYTQSSFTMDGIAVQDDLVYLGEGSNGLVIVNISDPTNPQKIGHYQGYVVPDVIVHNNFAFVRNLAERIIIINITEPTTPTFVSEIDYHEFNLDVLQDFIIQTNYLFLLASELVIFDVSNPAHPTIITRLPDCLGMKLTIQDDRLFILDTSTDYFKTLNVSNPYNPQLLNDVFVPELDEYVSRILLDNSTIYFSGFESLFTFKIEVNLTLSFLSSFTVHGQVNALAVKNFSFSNGSIRKIVFFGNPNSGLHILDYSNLYYPSQLAVYDFGSQAKVVSADNRYIYLVTEREFPTNPTSFMIFEFTNNCKLQLLSTYVFEQDVIKDLFIQGNHAFLAGYYSGLIILDISDPTTPVMVGNYSINNVNAIFYQKTNELIFLARATNGYCILNVTSKTNPQLLCQNIAWDMSIADLYVEHNLLFLADDHPYGGFGIVDISNPANPINLHIHYLNQRVIKVYVEGQVLYLSTEYFPMIIYNIENPLEPKRIGELSLDFALEEIGLTVSDSVAYLAQEGLGLLTVAVSNPHNLDVLVRYRDNYAGMSFDVMVQDNFIFLADGWDGLEILELIPPKISREVYLTITILPPTIGLVIVFTIVVIIIKRQKVNP